MRIIFLFITVLLAGCSDSEFKGLERIPSFYVWQRVISDGFEEQLLKMPDREFYIWAGEVDRNGFKRFNFDKALWRKLNATPVYRIHSQDLNDESLDLIVDSLGDIQSKKVQLDYDCPESKLSLYSHFLRTFRHRLPGYQISITALPCHLNNPEFIEVAKLVDFYVLQVHGIDIESVVANDYQIMTRTVALGSIDRAIELDKPFQVALPTYAYQLFFDEKGKFSSLRAENVVSDKTSRVTKLDYDLINEIFRKYPSLQYIWFRFPHQNDRLNLDLSTIVKLEMGEQVLPKVELELKNENGMVNLYLESDGLISLDRVEIELDWQDGKGEFDLFANARNVSENRFYGVLPTVISAEIPACGKKTMIASFYVNHLPECKLK